MADAPKLPSKADLLKHLEMVETTSISNTQGLTGHNPFMWAKRNVQPLRELVEAAKEVTAELAAKVQALKPLDKPKAA